MIYTAIVLCQVTAQLCINIRLLLITLIYSLVETVHLTKWLLFFNCVVWLFSTLHCLMPLLETAGHGYVTCKNRHLTTALSSTLVFLCLGSEPWLPPQNRLITMGLMTNTLCMCAADDMADL